ncbi:hypothetical protein AV530_003234 [Patagioenas fasciata monilis]|uniref:Uncharacterized protein n=1 Tax=Patagioenas fasciata monilis TaxID=372326 RepID=A0A1V4KWL5_PATFA|nr:hypothetical protein AV530_003234 [Patagioenas fasciata monilis]
MPALALPEVVFQRSSSWDCSCMRCEDVLEHMCLQAGWKITPSDGRGSMCCSGLFSLGCLMPRKEGMRR